MNVDIVLYNQAGTSLWLVYTKQDGLNFGEIFSHKTKALALTKIKALAREYGVRRYRFEQDIQI